MVVGVPIFAVLYAGFKSIVCKQLAKKKLPTETQPYLKVGSIEEDNTFTEYVPVKKKRKAQEKNDNVNTVEKEE